MSIGIPLGSETCRCRAGQEIGDTDREQGELLEALRARLPESGEAHAVIGCCLLDRFDPLIADLRSLL